MATVRIYETRRKFASSNNEITTTVEIGDDEDIVSTIINPEDLRCFIVTVERPARGIEA